MAAEHVGDRADVCTARDVQVELHERRRVADDLRARGWSRRERASRRRRRAGGAGRLARRRSSLPRRPARAARRRPRARGSPPRRRRESPRRPLPPRRRSRCGGRVGSRFGSACRAPRGSARAGWRGPGERAGGRWRAGRASRRARLSRRSAARRSATTAKDDGPAGLSTRTSPAVARSVTATESLGGWTTSRAGGLREELAADEVDDLVRRGLAREAGGLRVSPTPALARDRGDVDARRRACAG